MWELYMHLASNSQKKKKKNPGHSKTEETSELLYWPCGFVWEGVYFLHRSPVLPFRLVI